jgi:single-strand DNA-binding protein
MTINNLVLIGNLVETPVVQVTAGGVSRTRFRLASTERRRDATNDTWYDGDSVFMHVTCWRRLAENVVCSLDKGDRVIVSGRLRQWTAEKDGVRRTMHEIEADAIGPDLQRGIVSVARQRKPQPGEGSAPDTSGTSGPTEESASDADVELPAQSGAEVGDTELTDDPWLPPLAASTV